jgi:hypothetical protein
MQKRVNSSHSWSGPRRLTVENGACDTAKKGQQDYNSRREEGLFQAMVRFIFRASACSTRRNVIGQHTPEHG